MIEDSQIPSEGVPADTTASDTEYEQRSEQATSQPERPTTEDKAGEGTGPQQSDDWQREEAFRAQAARLGLDEERTEAVLQRRRDVEAKAAGLTAGEAAPTELPAAEPPPYEAPEPLPYEVPSYPPGQSPGIPQSWARLEEFANSRDEEMGLEAGTTAREYAPILGEAMAHAVEQTVGPWAEKTLAARLKDDARRQEYKESTRDMERFVRSLPLGPRMQMLSSDADWARARNLVMSEVNAAEVNRLRESQGNPQTVGRFTERASPGVTGETASLSREHAALLDAWKVTPEQRARLAAKWARRQGGG